MNDEEKKVVKDVFRKNGITKACECCKENDVPKHGGRCVVNAAYSCSCCDECKKTCNPENMKLRARGRMTHKEKDDGEEEEEVCDSDE